MQWFDVYPYWGLKNIKVAFSVSDTATFPQTWQLITNVLFSFSTNMELQHGLWPGSKESSAV